MEICHAWACHFRRGYEVNSVFIQDIPFEETKLDRSLTIQASYRQFSCASQISCNCSEHKMSDIPMSLVSCFHLCLEGLLLQRLWRTSVYIIEIVKLGSFEVFLAKNLSLEPIWCCVFDLIGHMLASADGKSIIEFYRFVNLGLCCFDSDTNPLSSI